MPDIDFISAIGHGMILLIAYQAEFAVYEV
jgi:hypothetical protein